MRQYQPRGNAVAWLDRIPVTNCKGIPLDGFQRSPHIDDQDSASEETGPLLFIGYYGFQMMQCPFGGEV
jgi:hypothetical protein